MLAVAVALGLDYMNDTIKTRRTSPGVKRRSSAWCLLRRKQHRCSRHRKCPTWRAVPIAPDLAALEVPERHQIIITSAQPLEGKTRRGQHRNGAGMAARVLLVDADMPSCCIPLRLTNGAACRGAHRPARVRDVIQRTVDATCLRSPPGAATRRAVSSE